jgi:potassium channel subfamily K
VILVILLLCYIAFGSLIHSITLHLNFIDAMYFSLVSIETIGQCLLAC